MSDEEWLQKKQVQQKWNLVIDLFTTISVLFSILFYFLQNMHQSRAHKIIIHAFISFKSFENFFNGAVIGIT